MSTLEETIAYRRQTVVDRNDGPIPHDITALQAEVALLRAKLKAAELTEWDLKEVLRQQEELHEPTEDDAIFERLAEAWATLEELGQANYLTDDCYNQVADALNEVINNAQWQTKPAILRKALPGIFRQALVEEEKRKALFDDAPTEPRRQAEAYDS